MRPQKNRGGGTLKETVLWTNPNPSNSFGETVLTLSENISNFDYIKVEWCESTTAQTNNSNIMIMVSEFTKYKNPNSNTHVLGGAMLARITNSIYARYIARESDSQVRIGQAVGLNTATINNLLVMPLNIYGLK